MQLIYAVSLSVYILGPYAPLNSHMLRLTRSVITLLSSLHLCNPLMPGLSLNHELMYLSPMKHEKKMAFIFIDGKTKVERG